MARESVWTGLWRPTGTPSKRVALGARSVGRADILPGWFHGTGLIQWHNIYWGQRGEVALAVNGKTDVIHADEVVVHPPGSSISGVENRVAGAYRWFTLNGKLAGNILKALELKPLCHRRAGRCPVELFDRLETEIRDITDTGEYRADATAYAILSLAASGGLDGGEDLELSRAREAREYLDANFRDSLLTVQKLARELGLHRSRLCRLFHQVIGITPSEYLQRLRLREAMTLLAEKDLTVRQVAFACGFSDPAYFSRVVRQEMGLNPRELRKVL
jgi:AraC-like DNA-binding protein